MRAVSAATCLARRRAGLRIALFALGLAASTGTAASGRAQEAPGEPAAASPPAPPHAPVYIRNERTPAPSPVPVAAAPPSAGPTGRPAAPAPGPGIPGAPGERPDAITPSGTDPGARPYFVKGPLGSGFGVQPMTGRSFIGLGVGLAALPSGTDTTLNAFFLSVQPQVDHRNDQYGWRLGLGVPLLFEIADTRRAFESCVATSRTQRDAGVAQSDIDTAATACVARQQGKATQGIGQLRREDWDQPGDFAKILRYFVVGGEERPFYFNASRLFAQSLGHGTVVRNYNANLDYNTTRVGATVNFYRDALGLESMVNDFVHPDLIGLLAFLRPLNPFADHWLAKSLSIGGSYVHALDVPRVLRFEPGLYSPSVGQPVPRLTRQLTLDPAEYAALDVLGVDAELKLWRSRTGDVKLYADWQKMRLGGQPSGTPNLGAGTTVGTLWRYSWGPPAAEAEYALRVRAEGQLFDADYLPSFFDGFYDVFKYQFLPAGYRSSKGLTYFPTKLAFLEASRGGPRRAGVHVEATWAWLRRLTIGAAMQTSRPLEGAAPGAGPLAFPDWTSDCAGLDPMDTSPQRGKLDCHGKTVVVADPGYTSARLHVEVPLKKYLQAFATYELFTTSLGGGAPLGFSGDNQILFSGARVQLLPILWLQGDARRYYFLQRVGNVDLAAGTLTQDQNFHASWTFSLGAYLGWEY